MRILQCNKEAAFSTEASEFCMRWLGAMLMGFGLSFCCATASAVEGTFYGIVVNPPAGAPQPAGWIYVQSKNHMLRRVDISHATIVFEQGIAQKQKDCRQPCLVSGDEVRVTAEQDRSGEWRAKRVEVLNAGTHLRRSSSQTLVTLSG
jgi:hypothetical protein